MSWPRLRKPACFDLKNLFKIKVGAKFRDLDFFIFNVGMEKRLSYGLFRWLLAVVVLTVLMGFGASFRVAAMSPSHGFSLVFTPLLFGLLLGILNGRYLRFWAWLVLPVVILPLGLVAALPLLWLEVEPSGWGRLLFLQGPVLAAAWWYYRVYAWLAGLNRWWVGALFLLLTQVLALGFYEGLGGLGGEVMAWGLAGACLSLVHWGREPRVSA